MFTSKEEVIAALLSREKAISSSALKAGKTSTKEFLEYYLKKKDPKSYFDFGNALELFLIDKVEFYKQVVVMDETKRPEPSKNYQTKVNAEWKAKFYEDNADKLIIPSDGKESFETIQILESLAKKHPSYDLLMMGEYQKAFTWTCPITGFKRYSRPDIVVKELNLIIDIKTDASDDFGRSANNNDHWIQALDQIQGAIASGALEKVDAYYWAVFEKASPHVTFYTLDLDGLLPIETVQERTLRRIKEDLESGVEIVWRDMPVKRLKVPTYYAKD